MEGMIDSRTKAILINNPSNPCGSSYSVEHLLRFVINTTYPFILLICSYFLSSNLLRYFYHFPLSYILKIPTLCKIAFKKFWAPVNCSIWRNYSCLIQRISFNRSVIDVARRHSLPIIADEIYSGCVFDQNVRHITYNTVIGSYTDVFLLYIQMNYSCSISYSDGFVYQS